MNQPTIDNETDIIRIVADINMITRVLLFSGYSRPETDKYFSILRKRGIKALEIIGKPIK